MISPHRVSIIVPVLDEASALPALLAACAPLRAAGAELIVADGGSRDVSVELATRGADNVVHCARGRARQMNAGAAAARGDVLLFLHADSVLPPQALKAIEAAISAGAHWGFFALTIVGQSRWLPIVSRLATLRSRLAGIATGDQALFVTRELFSAAGGFPEIALMEDIAFTRRLRRHARPAALSLRVRTAGRRWDEHGALRTIFLMWRLRSAYALGASSDRLARRYDDVRGRR